MCIYIYVYLKYISINVYINTYVVYVYIYTHYASGVAPCLKAKNNFIFFEDRWQAIVAEIPRLVCELENHFWEKQITYMFSKL